MMSAEIGMAGSGTENTQRGARSPWRRPSVVFAVLAVVVAAYTALQPEREAPPEAPNRAQGALVSEFSGIATVSDGDTLRIGDRRIQLDGIVTPQRTVMCGDVNVYRAAADALRDATRSEQLICRISDLPAANGQDRAQCTIDGASLNQHMVASGWARASDGAYADAEGAARAEARGLWALECPADLWRGLALE